MNSKDFEKPQKKTFSEFWAEHSNLENILMIPLCVLAIPFLIVRSIFRFIFKVIKSIDLGDIIEFILDIIFDSF